MHYLAGECHRGPNKHQMLRSVAQASLTRERGEGRLAGEKERFAEDALASTHLFDRAFWCGAPGVYCYYVRDSVPLRKASVFDKRRDLDLDWLKDELSRGVIWTQGTVASLGHAIGERLREVIRGVEHQNRVWRGSAISAVRADCRGARDFNVVL